METSTTWIMVATILGLTFVLTLSKTVGTKIYLRRKLIEKHNQENSDDIIFVTREVQSEILREYVPTANDLKSASVFWKIIYPNLTHKEEH